MTEPDAGAEGRPRSARCVSKLPHGVRPLRTGGGPDTKHVVRRDERSPPHAQPAVEEAHMVRKRKVWPAIPSGPRDWCNLQENPHNSQREEQEEEDWPLSPFFGHYSAVPACSAEGEGREPSTGRQPPSLDDTAPLGVLCVGSTAGSSLWVVRPQATPLLGWVRPHSAGTAHESSGLVT